MQASELRFSPFITGLVYYHKIPLHHIINRWALSLIINITWRRPVVFLGL